MKTLSPQRFAAAAALLLAPPLALACATCGCSLSTDAAMGYGASSGWRIGLQYDYIDQTQLRSGSGSISPAQVAALNPGAQQEVEERTTNRYTTASLSWSPNADWNLKALVPYIDRGHQTYGAATNPLTPDDLSGATLTGLGDIKLIGSWQGLLPTHALGLQLGLKLPTGAYGGGPDADGNNVGRGYKNFNYGPNIGSPVDTSLQPGTGSTDLILGAYYFQAVSQNFDAFVNGQFQAAVSEKLDQAGADYRPGNNATISFGTRYEANPDLVPQLQVNINRKSADQGFLADTTDTAGTVAYLSPGVTARLASRLYVFGFVQLPVYSRLAGYQLFPRWTASVGASWAF